MITRIFLYWLYISLKEKTSFSDSSYFYGYSNEHALWRQQTWLPCCFCFCRLARFFRRVTRIQWILMCCSMTSTILLLSVEWPSSPCTGLYLQFLLDIDTGYPIRLCNKMTAFTPRYESISPIRYESISPIWYEFISPIRWVHLSY